MKTFASTELTGWPPHLAVFLFLIYIRLGCGRAEIRQFFCLSGRPWQRYFHRNF
jgi:hypothetical protein